MKNVDSSENRITRIPTHRKKKKKKKKRTEDQMKYISEAKISKILYQKQEYLMGEYLTSLQVENRISSDPHIIS